MEKKKNNNVRSNVGKMNVQTTEQIELKNFVLDETGYAWLGKEYKRKSPPHHTA